MIEHVFDDDGELDWLGELNDRQREAATAPPARPLLILAGAGSGKTATLSARVAWLIAQGLGPERILLLTFTRLRRSRFGNSSPPDDGRPEPKRDRPFPIEIPVAWREGYPLTRTRLRRLRDCSLCFWSRIHRLLCAKCVTDNSGQRYCLKLSGVRECSQSRNSSDRIAYFRT